LIESKTKDYRVENWTQISSAEKEVDVVSKPIPVMGVFIVLINRRRTRTVESSEAVSELLPRHRSSVVYIGQAKSSLEERKLGVKGVILLCVFFRFRVGREGVVFFLSDLFNRYVFSVIAFFWPIPPLLFFFSIRHAHPCRCQSPPYGSVFLADRRLWKCL